MTHTKLTSHLDSLAQETYFSGVISIQQDRKSIYQSAFGYADRSSRISNRVDTRFGIASGTKIFTALSIGKLIESGHLDFSSRVAELIPWDFPQYSAEVTIRQLLTHTSGIPDYYDEENVDDFDNFTVAVPWQELKGPRDYLAVFPDQAMKFPPGERFSYSNGGYILLGVVIEELSGMRFQDFVEQQIFLSIGMSRSGFFAMNRLPENTAFGYVEDAQGWRTNIYNLPIIGASDGGAYTTVQDLEKFWDALWGNRILSRELTDIFTAPYVEASSEGRDKFYGHGIWVRSEPGKARENYIIGSDAGVSFYSGVIRDRQLQFSVMSNTSDGAWPILQTIDKELMT